MNWLEDEISVLEQSWLDQALAHQNQLTKPPGSLGVLEEVAIRLCAMQQTLTPQLQQVAIRVFAGDHGVVAEGVSAFPQAVTVEMIRNFDQGGAAISVLAKAQQADFAVVNMGTALPASEGSSILQYPVAAGTENFCQQPAMSQTQLDQAFAAGKAIAEHLAGQNAQLFIGGEMGIGNTTAASALACALLDENAEALVGRGTGVDDAGLQRKAEVVSQALALHREAIESDGPLMAAQCLGGFEIIALAGAYLRCAQLRIPSLVDGFICSAAALLAIKINPQCRDWLFFSHQSAEQGHARILQAIEAQPLLQLNLRLGEGSGAATALPLLKLACELHNGMASFADAGVSQSE